MFGMYSFITQIILACEIKRIQKEKDNIANQRVKGDALDVITAILFA